MSEIVVHFTYCPWECNLFTREGRPIEPSFFPLISFDDTERQRMIEPFLHHHAPYLIELVAEDYLVTYYLRRKDGTYVKADGLLVKLSPCELDACKRRVAGGEINSDGPREEREKKDEHR